MNTGTVKTMISDEFRDPLLTISIPIDADFQYERNGLIFISLILTQKAEIL